MKRHVYLLIFVFALFTVNTPIFSINIIKLLKNIFFINTPNKYGHTKLYKACCNKKLRDIKILLKHRNLNVNKSDNYGRTPLHEVCIEGYLEIFTKLINHKNINVNQIDNDGCTPLFLACLNNHTKIAELLLKHGAIIDEKTLEVLEDKPEIKKYLENSCN